MNPEIINLRLSIGMQSSDFEVPMSDYKELLIFSAAQNFGEFKAACDQVKCKYPTLAQFSELETIANADDDDLCREDLIAAEEARKQYKLRILASGAQLRIRGSEGNPPEPQDIKVARTAAGLSQTAAAALIYSTLRTWQDWEAGKAKMHPGLWELFRSKLAS